MGSGSWSSSDFVNYVSTSYGGYVDSYTGAVTTAITNQEMFKARHLDPALDPKGVIRECRDSDEHPNTIPVIIGLDVTGSMGESAVEVAKKLNVIMTELYEKVTDVEFMIMGIGDFYCDDTPVQASQFESDIRIAEQLDKIYFEFGGGGNSYESYTAAWYFGSRHCELDCWKRGKKGIIITMGDERLNPYIPKTGMSVTVHSVLGDTPQADIDTKELYKEASEKFDIYHLNVDHGYAYDTVGINNSWREYLDDYHYRTVNMDNIADTIIDIIIKSAGNTSNNVSVTIDGISW